MDYVALKVALEAPELAGLTNGEAAEILSAQTVPMIRDVPTAEARAVLLATGEWGGIVLASRMTPSAGDDQARLLDSGAANAGRAAAGGAD